MPQTCCAPAAFPMRMAAKASIAEQWIVSSRCISPPCGPRSHCRIRERALVAAIAAPVSPASCGVALIRGVAFASLPASRQAAASVNACFVALKPRKLTVLPGPAWPECVNLENPLSDLVLWLDQLRLSDLGK